MAAVAVFVVGEIFYLFASRSLDKSMFALGLFTNPRLLIGVAVMLALQLAFTYVPLMNSIFESAPIGAAEWLVIVAIGLVIYLVVETEKWLRRRGAPVPTALTPAMSQGS